VVVVLKLLAAQVHLNTTEMVDLLGTEDAARLNAHEGTAMVGNI
jgi:hypothetical protein